jgi:hypothetical protein
VLDSSDQIDDGPGSPTSLAAVDELLLVHVVGRIGVSEGVAISEGAGEGHLPAPDVTHVLDPDRLEQVDYIDLAYAFIDHRRRH